jgi:hypothetical protein
MPLNPSALSNGLESCFANPAPDAGGCGQQWANAMQSYAAALVPPSTTIAAAATTLAGALGAAFATPAAIGAMESAFSAFGATVALGQAPLFAGVPPSGPVGFAAQFGGPAPETHGEAASAIARRIDTWMRTGVGNLVAPPNTPTPWT